MNKESVADKEELKPGVFINISVLYVRISRLPYSYCIVIMKFFLLQQSLRLLMLEILSQYVGVTYI